MTEDHDRAEPTGRRLVVGVDGSAAAQAALAWALEEAALRRAALEVVFAWQFPFDMAAGNPGVPAPAGEMRLWARDVVDQALEAVEVGDRVPVVRRPEYGAAVPVLMAAARGAELLVVGTRGHGRLSTLLLGSVSQHLAVHAPCPVVVVHGPAAERSATVAASSQAQEAAGGEAHGVLEAIPEEECWALLAGHSVGRLVVVRGDAPQALPVNYVLDNHTVAVRTTSGDTLDWATLGKVAFEIDHIDEEHHLGWSVLVQGVGRDVTEGLDEWSEHLRAQELEPWAGGERTRWIAIASPHVSGRRIRRSAGVGAPHPPGPTPHDLASPSVTTSSDPVTMS
jgi:nucleotide-binding universal stress UspA family protein/nitroimidazol reductase NimA-like FMN-containing flavoprotein (pyridoxamine 5'-phosphate oxidase superfamily)